MALESKKVSMERTPELLRIFLLGTAGGSAAINCPSDQITNCGDLDIPLGIICEVRIDIMAPNQMLLRKWRMALKLSKTR